ncbi:MAG: hypothetical protein N2C12_05705, partial [Planctomycetales bacterium]
LMLSAVIAYRKTKDLMHKQFLDEIGFALLAVTCPIVLMQLGLDTHVAVVPALFVFFFVYHIVDRRLNRHVADQRPPEDGKSRSITKGLLFIVAALVVVVVVGDLLGTVTGRVVTEMKIPAIVAGSILGLITSLPELTTFFAVYSKAKKRDQLSHLHNTQEVLDNLTSSNMSNVGLIYPIGLTVYLVVTN